MTSRYDQLSERARFYLDNFDELDMAEMLAGRDNAAPDNLRTTSDNPVASAIASDNSEIERLRKELARMQAASDHHIGAAEQERDQFRAAMGRVQDLANQLRATVGTLNPTPEQRVGQQLQDAIDGEGLARSGDALMEQPDKPRHPDGTEYRYAELEAGNWGFCDGCRLWSNATMERPHQCAMTYIAGPTTDGDPE